MKGARHHFLAASSFAQQQNCRVGGRYDTSFFHTCRSDSLCPMICSKPNSAWISLGKTSLWPVSLWHPAGCRPVPAAGQYPLTRRCSGRMGTERNHRELLTSSRLAKFALRWLRPPHTIGRKDFPFGRSLFFWWELRPRNAVDRIAARGISVCDFNHIW
jgi:hypothetical protein